MAANRCKNIADPAQRKKCEAKAKKNVGKKDINPTPKPRDPIIIVD